MCPECGITAFTTDARQPGRTSQSDGAAQFADPVLNTADVSLSGLRFA